MITFGTDGWRGVISDDFTFQNVRLVAKAVGGYILDRQEEHKGVVIGYDARFLSCRYAQLCAETLAGCGIKVWLADSILPTPALTWRVKDAQAALGLMITASHNPPEYNGIKLKAAYGGPASPELVADVEAYVRRYEAGDDLLSSGKKQAIAAFSPRSVYFDRIRQVLDLEILKAYRGKILVDMMHGSAAGYAAEFAKEYGLDVSELHGEYNPGFGGINPEPIEKNLQGLRKAILETNAAIGLATDGDGDRIGLMDDRGRFINAYQIIALLARYLSQERGWSGGIAQSLTLSGPVRSVGTKLGIPLYETPVGFKYITKLMLEKDILIGGEEAGGVGIKNYIPERDGLLLGFLLIEMTAYYGKPLSHILDDFMDKYGRFYYARRDLQLATAAKERLVKALSDNPPDRLGDIPVLSVVSGDGTRLSVPGGWVILRASGTEPLVRIYAEMPSQQELDNLLEGAILYGEHA